MATKTLTLQGENLIADSNLTLLCDGVSKFSGPLSKAVTSGNGENSGTLDTWTVDVEVQTQGGALPTEDHSISISVVSGSVNIGAITVLAQNGDDSYDTVDERKNILIDGVAPEWPTGNDVLPGGTEADPDWSGWAWTLTAGETLTCVVTVEGQQYTE